MLFFTYDLEDYRDTLRGFNFDFVAEAPGPLLKTSDEVIQSIVNIDKVAQEHDEALQKFRKKSASMKKVRHPNRFFKGLCKISKHQDKECNSLSFES